MAKQDSDTVSTLEPSTTKEWLVHINNRLNAVILNQSEFRDTQDALSEKMDTVITCQATQDIRIDHLETKVNGWNVINSIGVVIAGILAILLA